MTKRPLTTDEQAPGRHEQALLDGLDLILSTDQLRQVAAAALLCLDEDALSRAVGRLDEETGRDLEFAMETWHEVIAAHQRGEEYNPEDDDWWETSRQKREIGQRWSELWDEWQAIVEETFDEQGHYVHQEHHWEAPFLSTWELTEDLEGVAKKLRPLIPKVIALDIDPDFSFAEALIETNGDIGAGLPEWIMGWDEEGAFGPEVTGCLLDWLWNRASAEAFDVVDQVLRLEDDSELPLDLGAVEDFALELDETAQRDLYRGILEHQGEPRWERTLASVHRGLFGLQAELLRRFDPTEHLRLCRATIDHDWRRALPVLEDLMGRQDYAEAEAVARQAARGWFPRRPGEDKWDPRRELLVEQGFMVRDAEPKATLLETWAEAARRTGQQELARALELQAVILSSWADWDTVLGELARAADDGFKALADQFFQRWRDRVVRRSQKSVRPEESWVALLADAAREGSKPPAFHRSLRRWLKEAGRSAPSLREHRDALAQLTLLIDHGELQQLSETLHTLLGRRGRLDETLRGSLRAWLERLVAGSLRGEVIDCWRVGLTHLVPDPSSARGSDYREQADWLRVAYDLDRETFDQLIARWRKKHGRKRNLWAAIEARGIPLP